MARRPGLLRSAAVLCSSADEEAAGCNALPLEALMFGDTTLASRPEVRNRWQRHFAGLDRSVLPAAEGVLLRKSVLGELVGARVPLLVLSGDEDNVYGSDRSQPIADTAANAHHVVIRHAGNTLPVERPDAVNTHLAAHFAAT